MKILPRLLLEGWSMADFQEVFASEASMKEVGNFIVKNLKVSICTSSKRSYMYSYIQM